MKEQPLAMWNQGEIKQGALGLWDTGESIKVDVRKQLWGQRQVQERNDSEGNVVNHCPTSLDPLPKLVLEPTHPHLQLTL